MTVSLASEFDKRKRSSPAIHYSAPREFGHLLKLAFLVDLKLLAQACLRAHAHDERDRGCGRARQIYSDAVRVWLSTAATRGIVWAFYFDRDENLRPVETI